jgi:RNA polymerase sigma-70 factor (ECF subfamily)
MPTEDKTLITQLLRAWSEGDREALNRVAPLVYQEVHRIAVAYMHREREGHAFTPASLVSEAFVRIAAGEPTAPMDRIRFLALVASIMRRILVDHARYDAAHKRGQRKNQSIRFDETLIPNEVPVELVALDEALIALSQFDARKARVVELHYFGGMSYEEIAAAFDVSERTVARDVRAAECWLRQYMTVDD